ncbi:MAG: hypothetical protein E4H13_12060 [Calditrichales bacterium]|nr:MAG: hypothetical protein E4H13_12060 [Calditrichales bacterium]
MKSTILTFLIAIFVILNIAGCSNSSDPAKPDDDDQSTNQWVIESVVLSAQYPSLAVDGEGIPHVSFLDDTDGYVKYAVRSGNSWTIFPVGKVSNVNGTVANGGISSLALDATGNPHITYYDYGNAQFKYATKSGNGWNLLTIPLPNDPLMSYASPFIPWEESNIVIDQQNGTVHVSLQMLGGLSVYVLGYWRAGMPEAVIVDNNGGNTGYNNAIALDSNGAPCISYEARGTGELRYTHWNGLSFDTETVASMPNIYWMERLTSIGVDNANVPHIAFYGQGGYKYAHKNGASWIIKDISFQSGYPAVSLDLDGSGAPHIGLVTIDSGNSYRLKYARLNGDTWVFENISDNIDNASIKRDQSGKIHLLYETDSNELKYAHN